MCSPRLRKATLLFTASLLPALPSLLPAQNATAPQASSYRRHDDPVWLAVVGHLPDPAIASPATLEEQGDLLRVRRFPEDALDYYKYALKRGGLSADLMNKIGLTQLELRNIVLAQGYFRQAVKVNRLNAQGWNNLGASEYLQREYAAALSDYKHAVKLDKSNAIFHANLSTTYFEIKDYKKARREADLALKLDPTVFHKSSGLGVSAHVLSVDDRARFAFEMAKLYAHNGQEDEMLHALGVACENGFDVLTHMLKDPDLQKYQADPRIASIVATANAMHRGETTASLQTEGPPEVR